MSRRRRGRVRQFGFTLLELLIAMTLLGLILVLLFGGLRLGVRSWDAAQLQVDNMNSVRSLENFLRREMAQANPYRFKGGTGQPLAFLGERNRLSFVAPMSARAGGGGLHLVSVEIEQTGQARRMVWKNLSVSARMQDFSALAQAPAMVLAAAELGDVEDIWLSYFGRESDSVEPQWFERWESSARLPLLIRVQVRLAKGGTWPEFVVAPMLSAEQAR